MDIVKVIGVGIIGAVIAATLKNWKNEFYIYIVLGTGVVLLIYILSSLSAVIASFNDLIDKSNINSDLFSGILKIIGIGYLTEYSASICQDTGAGSIAEKIELGGKITIFLMAFPVIKALIDVLSSFIM